MNPPALPVPPLEALPVLQMHEIAHEEIAPVARFFELCCAALSGVDRMVFGWYVPRIWPLRGLSHTPSGRSLPRTRRGLLRYLARLLYVYYTVTVLSVSLTDMRCGAR